MDTQELATMLARADWRDDDLDLDGEGSHWRERYLAQAEHLAPWIEERLSASAHAGAATPSAQPAPVRTVRPARRSARDGVLDLADLLGEQNWLMGLAVLMAVLVNVAVFLR